VLGSGHWLKVRIGLLLSPVLIAVGVVFDSLFSASPALDDGLLVSAAVVIGIALFATRGRGVSN
jgi:hypothetical protein